MIPPNPPPLLHCYGNHLCHTPLLFPISLPPSHTWKKHLLTVAMETDLFKTKWLKNTEFFFSDLPLHLITSNWKYAVKKYDIIQLHNQAHRSQKIKTIYLNNRKSSDYKSQSGWPLCAANLVVFFPLLLNTLFNWCRYWYIIHEVCYRAGKWWHKSIKDWEVT